MNQVNIKLDLDLAEAIGSAAPDLDLDSALNMILRDWMSGAGTGDEDPQIDLIRLDDFDRTGLGVPADEMVSWLKARSEGQILPFPVSRPV